jgi:5-methylthioadenosine/S-adenosylhomocysteine deaminase
MSLLRGYAEDLPLDNWLKKRIWPLERRVMNSDFVRDGTQLAAAEMIKSGTTCFADMYFYPETSAEVLLECGMRSQIGFPVFDDTSVTGQTVDQQIHCGLQLHDTFKGHDLINIACAPHSLSTVGIPTLTAVATYANELDLPVHIHAHETAGEIIQVTHRHGQRPLQLLCDIGLLLPQTQLVHMTQLDDEDLRLLQEHNSHVIHCPQSNLKLASGFCPLAKLIDRGINVALGTDSAASNNDLDLFSELQTATLLAKGISGDAGVMPAHRALRMATLDGAKALGSQSDFGSLETGKYADAIAIDMNSIQQQPLYNLASQLLYTHSGSRVSHNWVAGKILLKDGKLQTLNESSLIRSAQRWRDKTVPDQSPTGQ